MTSGTIMGLSGIRRAPLREQARHELRSLITAGAITPGELHSIGSVAEQLGVSITPVREALLDLEGDGLVEMVRNRGFRVATLTDRDLDELVELRLLLEVPTVVRVAQMDPQPDLSELRAIAEQMVEHAENRDIPAFLQLDREFHLGLLALGGNSRLVATVGLLRDQTRLYGIEQVAGTEEFLHTADEHPELISLVAAGDAEQAGALMRRHLLHVRGLWAGKPHPAEVSR